MDSMLNQTIQIIRSMDNQTIKVRYLQTFRRKENVELSYVRAFIYH